ncbi:MULTISPECIES: IclR family transcriptional regulator [Roseobacteraceae]|uniref:Acetate operon repressor n=1 Tax=Pseudosulfitobacter pseudonitzschiae TaxID=1402135 RepID=A0A221JXI4_9RHOB|nr:MULTISPECIES: IclR family transcriptional regulator [Roseobacteraceae]ASM71393.1 acetate operon repressor [Pseudosulfitobacter pseudonitzschiae]
MSKTSMSTVDKALALLRYFSVQHPEIGLSELSRLAGYDKTTILRCMTALERNGFIEQSPETKRYRLGLAPATYARIRERSFPLMAFLQPQMDRLAANTGETAHATVVTGHILMTVQISEPDRATRVYIDPSIPLPVHATASGIVIAAHLPDAQRADLVAHSAFQQFTDSTTVDPQLFNDQLARARAQGFARADRSFENDVMGTAAAFFGPNGVLGGAVAVAAVASRFDARVEARIVQEVRAAAASVTQQLGGTLPTAPAGGN